MFTARYGLIPYVKNICFFKMLIKILYRTEVLDLRAQ